MKQIILLAIGLFFAVTSMKIQHSAAFDIVHEAIPDLFKKIDIGSKEFKEVAEKELREINQEERSAPNKSDKAQ